MNTRRQLLWTVAATAAAVLVIVAVSSAITAAIQSSSIRETQTENTTVLETSSETLKIIRECTTPGRPCYDRGQKSTAEVVAQLTSDLTRVSAYAAACADRPGVQGKDEIFACVVTQLAAEATVPAKP